MDYKLGMEPELEILVATMNRNSLGFLDSMFVNNDISKLHILVVNQTTEDCLLTSPKPNIRVVNSFEKGLSRSRNLAIKNAIGEICLLTDDDVVYVEGFAEIVIKAFSEYPNAGIIHFKAKDFENKDYRFYPNKTIRHDMKSVKGIMSIEIAFRKDRILFNHLLFDERFGLGSQFETGEEYLFTREVIGSGLNVYFYNDYIVSHDVINSGKDLGSDRIIYARAALNYSIHKQLSNFWIIKYIIFLLKNNYIVIDQTINKIKVAVKGIKDFKRTHNRVCKY